MVVLRVAIHSSSSPAFGRPNDKTRHDTTRHDQFIHQTVLLPSHRPFQSASFSTKKATFIITCFLPSDSLTTAVTSRVSNLVHRQTAQVKSLLLIPPVPVPEHAHKSSRSIYILCLSCSDVYSPAAQRGTYFLSPFPPPALTHMYLLVW